MLCSVVFLKRIDDVVAQKKNLFTKKEFFDHDDLKLAEIKTFVSAGINPI